MERPVITVKQGKLQGIFEDNVLGSRYLAFKGIPFAAPPVGELRFKDPKPPASWEGIRDASKNAGDVSIQLQTLPFFSVIGSEDCLYLNVYIPHNIYRTTRNPVMVFIHGGAFLIGNGNDINKRPDYLMAKDVILVSINYRLGALGFLNVGHEEVSGNQGLKDQVAALKWVKENIEIFGGDPNNITIFGVSAGGLSAHLLMMSPLSKDTSQETLDTTYADLEVYVKRFTNWEDSKKIARLTEKVKQHYFHNKPPTKESIPSFIQCLSDISFSIPIKNYVNDQRKKKRAPIYYYNFSYVGNEMNNTKYILNELPMIGASHTDDMAYLFYQPIYKANDLKPPAIGTKDRNVLEILTTMWTNFAKTGNPTPAVDEYVTTIWLPAIADSFNLLDIGDTLQLLTITDHSIFEDLEDL
ncbi:hypothetical protein ACFW04_007943 [Cataglyphis niger]